VWGIGGSLAGWAVRRGRCAGWLRRFASRAEAVRVAFTELLCALDPDPPVLGPAGCPVADAVAAVLAAARAVVRRWGEPVCGLSPWELAGAVSGGRLLQSGSTVDSINTSCPGEPDLGPEPSPPTIFTVSREGVRQ